MATAAQRLLDFGIQIADARAWLLAQTDPAFVVSVFQAGGFTNAMIGEIANYPGTPYAAADVKAFFAQFGVDSSMLDPAPTVVSVTSASAAEGLAIQHTITLSSATTALTELPLSISLDSVAISDFAAYSLSNGVTLASFASLQVPAGVSQFTFSFTSTNDSQDEADEGYTIVVGGVSATGTIVDNDAPPPVDVTVLSVASPQAQEGSDLHFAVTLSGTTGAQTIFNWAYDGGTFMSNDLNNSLTLTAGVTMNGGQLIVPAGVSAFDFVLGTADDAMDEPDEFINLIVGGASGTGTIMDNDATPVLPTVQSVTSASATEGLNIVHTVTLSGPAVSPDGVDESMVIPFSIGGGTAGEADWMDVFFSNGVSISEDNIYVPVGVSAFTATVMTVNDTLDEPDETLNVSVGGVVGVATIVDNDDPAPIGSTLLPTPIDGFAPVLDLNDRTGALSTLTLRTTVLNAVADDSKYWSLFAPAKYGGSSDGVFTMAELGVSHLGDLPATAGTIESLYYGTFLDIALSIDFSEAGVIGPFFINNLAAIFAHAMPATGQYVSLFVEAEMDAAPFGSQAHTEGSMAVSIPLGMINATSNAGLQENIFWGLLNI